MAQQISNSEFGIADVVGTAVRTNETAMSISKIGKKSQTSRKARNERIAQSRKNTEKPILGFARERMRFS